MRWFAIFQSSLAELGFHLGAHSEGTELLIRQNDYGVAFFMVADGKSDIDAISQYSRDGENWGVNANILRQGKIGLVAISSG